MKLGMYYVGIFFKYFLQPGVFGEKDQMTPSLILKEHSYNQGRMEENELDVPSLIHIEHSYDQGPSPKKRKFDVQMTPIRKDHSYGKGPSPSKSGLKLNFLNG